MVVLGNGDGVIDEAVPKNWEPVNEEFATSIEHEQENDKQRAQREAL